MRMELEISDRKDGVSFECRVTPRASKSAAKGVREGRLLVSLNSPPVDGRANEELVEFLSGVLRVPKSRIAILRGDRGRTKLLFVQGITADALLRAIFAPR